MNRFDKAYFEVLYGKRATPKSKRLIKEDTDEKCFLIEVSLISAEQVARDEYSTYEEALKAINSDIEFLKQFGGEKTGDFSSPGGSGDYFAFVVPAARLKEFLTHPLVGLPNGLIFILSDAELTNEDIKEMPLEELIDYCREHGNHYSKMEGDSSFEDSPDCNVPESDLNEFYCDMDALKRSI